MWHVRDAGAMTSSDDGSTDAFESIVGDIDYPMYLVTAAAADGERSGCMVGFTTQASIQPRRFMALISKENHTFGVAQDAVVLVVHLLRRGDEELAARFGETTGDQVDKFEGLAVLDGPGGTPVIEGLDWFAGRVLRTFDCGDHVAFLLAPHDGVALRGANGQLGFQDVKGMEPGHSS
jgi:flavin reductase (DIM6/NTAB) family NADH-FMN oxidoreductase RutF